jgi:hypothetical protein
LIRGWKDSVHCKNYRLLFISLHLLILNNDSRN